MKISNETITISSEKIKKDYTICLIADIHNTKYTTYKLYYKLLEKLKSLKPDFILIPGDIIYTADDLYKESTKNKLSYLLKELVKISIIFVCLGNHDLKNGKVLKASDTLKYFRDFESENKEKFYLLENEMFITEDFNIIGLSPQFEAYYIRFKDYWMKYFLDTLINFDLSKREINDNFTIIMTHSPEVLSDTEEYIVKSLKNPDISEKEIAGLEKAKMILSRGDIFVCGHMHDGNIPKHWQRFGIVKEDKGIAASEGDGSSGPAFRIVSKCRGIHDLYNGKLIITGGLNKWCDPNPLFALVNTGMAKDITTITLKRKL